ncbi:MAG: hypothetical protein ACLPV8_21045 [Steroidobacteraceae bacterium]
MAKESHSGRDNAAKKAGKENTVTSGGIETAVKGFFGNITTETPFSPTYGNHKVIGSEMLPTTGAKGRGGAKQFFRNKLNTGGN